MSLVAVVLAAGASRRMGADKLWLPIEGKPIVVRVLDAVADATLDDWRVVVRDPAPFAGHVGEERLLVHPDPDQGMGSSLAIGAAWAAQNHPEAGLMVVLADMPWLTAGDLDILVAAFGFAEGKDIVAPVTDGKRGHPVLFPADLVPELAVLTGDRGARDVIERNAVRVSEVRTPIEAFLRDVDEPADLA